MTPIAEGMDGRKIHIKGDVSQSYYGDGVNFIRGVGVEQPGDIAKGLKEAGYTQQEVVTIEDKVGILVKNIVPDENGVVQECSGGPEIECLKSTPQTRLALQLFDSELQNLPRASFRKETKSKGK